ncbi:hypothetical protein SISSUDRAFT_1054112 [Sistotremastrum suecicum HHB10207 ss-3]|uniref:F-box domain-containing protein n=1 Tax=Sistotremastrum suecicum HHB10207 ss-3 TaxID=1314776 RepID=A0A165YRF5_9AGAM|nr:hypothetical protein SISSUDRAFT_1054112 [Sistotremastrum suecicum HHB10207 ss-3]
MASSKLQGLPTELIFAILDGASLRDLHAISQTCQRLHNIATTSRQFWANAADKDILPLPTGYTFDTIPVEQIFSIAARGIGWQKVTNNEPAKPRRYLPYAVEDEKVRLNLLALPGNSWYIEQRVSGSHIKRAEPGWENVAYLIPLPGDTVPNFRGSVIGGGDMNLVTSIRLPGEIFKTQRILHIMKMHFPDERQGPAEPYLKDRSQIVLPHPAFNSIIEDKIFLTATIERSCSRLLLLNRLTNIGLILNYPDQDPDSQEEPTRWVASISLNEKAQKIVVVSLNQGEGDRESGQLIEKIDLVDIPDDLFGEQELGATNTPSEAIWTNRAMTISHSFTVPEYDAKAISHLPSKLPPSAIRLTTFTFKKPENLDSDEPSQIQQFGSLYIDNDNLLVFYTHELDGADINTFSDNPYRANGVSQLLGIERKTKGEILELCFVKPGSTVKQKCRLVPPDDIPGMTGYAVEGFDTTRGRLFIKVFREGEKYIHYAVQY